MRPFSPAELADPAELHQAAAKLIAAGWLAHPALPQTARALIDLTRRPVATFDEAVALLNQSPLLASRIVRRARMGMVEQISITGSGLAEAPRRAFGRSRRPDMRELKHVSLWLGIIGLRDLAFELSAVARIFRAPGCRDTMRVLRRHALAVAHLARLICKHLAVNIPEPFLAGLLHDAGWALLVRAIAASQEQPRLAADLSLFYEPIDALHIGATRALARSWNLSPDAQSAIELHHQADLSQAPPLAAVLALAQELALPWTRAMDMTQLGPGAQLLAQWTLDAIPDGQGDSARARLGINAETWQRISLAAATIEPRTMGT